MSAALAHASETSSTPARVDHAKVVVWRLAATISLAAATTLSVACPSEVPKGLRAQSVGEETVVNGLPMTILEVNGKEAATDVLARVAKSWADDKFDVRADRAGEWDVVSARSGKCNTTLQLMDRDGGSFGYFAVATPARSTDWLPKRLGFTMPNGITLNSTVSSRDGARAGHTIAFSTKRSVADINEYFYNELTRAGWQAVTSRELRLPNKAPSKVVSAQKGHEQVSVVLFEDGLTRAVLNLADAL